MSTAIMSERQGPEYWNSCCAGASPLLPGLHERHDNRRGNLGAITIIVRAAKLMARDCLVVSCPCLKNPVNGSA
jgi:hypothetical protein